jgi:hypothetical protein
LKRSTQIGLFLVGTLGVTSASGYYLMNREPACRNNPDRTDQDCRHTGSSHWSSSSSSGRPLFGDTSTVRTPSTSAPSSSAQRSGFGAIGHALGLSGS